MRENTAASTEPRSVNARVLVVDDEENIRQLMQRVLEKDGYAVSLAEDGPAALAAVVNTNPDLILCDIGLPGMDGFELCRRLKENRRTRLTPVVLMTGLADRDRHMHGLAIGADDFLAKPLDTQELLVRTRSLVRMKRYTDDLDSVASFVMTFAVMLEARDGNTEGHCHRMANYATALGRHLELDEDAVQTLHRGGFLHDIGMLTVPESVLRKPAALTPEEFELVQSHTTVGESLCGNLRSLQSVRPIIRHHHERLDGSGYPDGLDGDAIPLTAQIIGLVDVFEAITTQRPYQRAKSIEEAVDVLRGQVQRGWRRGDLVEAFASLVESGRLDTFTLNAPKS